MVDLVKLEELAKGFKDLSVQAHCQASRDWDEQDDVPPAFRALGNTFSEAATALSSARAEIERLREALKGFTHVADAFPWVKPEHEDGTFLWTDGRPNGKQISIGQLRRAAALVREQEE